MDVTALIFSERPNGCTGTIAEECIRGAADSGHEVKKYHINGMTIVDPADGADATEEFAARLVSGGAVMLAVPQYRWGTFFRVILRLERKIRNMPRPKEPLRAVMVVTSTADGAADLARVRAHYTARIARRFGWEERGFIVVQVNASGDAPERDMAAAYALGLSI